MRCAQVAREIQIHSSVEHPNILGLYAAFEDLDGIYLVQELAPGGDLYRAMGNAGGYLPEEEVAQRVMRPLMSALACLHHQVPTPWPLPQHIKVHPSTCCKIWPFPAPAFAGLNGLNTALQYFVSGHCLSLILSLPCLDVPLVITPG